MNKDANELMPGDYETVLADVVTLLEDARRQAARSVNAILTAAYWEIGRRLVEVEQAGEARAGYGERLIERLSEDLSTLVLDVASGGAIWTRCVQSLWSTVQLRRHFLQNLNGAILPSREKRRQCLRN